MSEVEAKPPASAILFDTRLKLGEGDAAMHMDMEIIVRIIFAMQRMS